MEPPNTKKSSRKHTNTAIAGTLVQQEQPSIISRRIPLEIFLEILGHYEPVPNYYDETHTFRPGWRPVRFDALNSMALVCKDFSARLQPLLFETAWMSASNHFASIPKLLGCSRFAKAIIDGNDRARALARHVTRYVVSGLDLKTYDTDNGDMAPTLGTRDQHFIFSSALRFMPSVREIHVLQHSITDELLRAIVLVPSLMALRLHSCNVPQPLDESLLRQFSTLEVSHVLLSGLGSDAPAEEQFFSHLCMSRAETLTSHRDISSHFFKGLSTLPVPMQSLTIISFDCSFIMESADHQAAFLDAFRAMPALCAVHWNAITYRSVNTRTFRPYSYPSPPRLPHLEYIYAHLPVLEALVPGSNVTSIGIASEIFDYRSEVSHPQHREFWERLAAVINKSQKPIDSLNVPMLFYTSIPFAERFPKLRYLTLKPRHRNWVDKEVYLPELFVDDPAHVIQMLLHGWPRHPNLIELEFVFDDFPGEPFTLSTPFRNLFPIRLDNTTLDQVKEKMPALQRLSFAFAYVHDERDRQNFVFG